MIGDEVYNPGDENPGDIKDFVLGGETFPELRLAKDGGQHFLRTVDGA